MIAWLEELAGADLDRAEAEAEAAGGSGAHFAPGDGMPRETLACSEQSAVLAQMRPAAGHSLVSQLDPDAPTRWISLGLRCISVQEHCGYSSVSRAIRFGKAGNLGGLKHMHTRYEA